MQKRDLAVGARVWVVRPYEGGRGYAEIIDLNASGGLRSSYTVRVRFEPGHTAHGEQVVAPAHITRLADAS